MKNGNPPDAKTEPAPSLAYYDFYKTNGAKVVAVNNEPSLTRQEFADECDINKLMARYETHVVGGPGNLPPINPVYVDFAEMPSNLMDYMLKMDEAEAAFMSLPAAVRKEFDNSAVAFVDYASDPGNLEQMRSWGLAPPKPPEAPGTVQPGPAPAGSTAPAGAPASPGGAPAHGST